jgi:hypothetical protein
MVGAGVAATVGNVYEPYLQLTHNLDFFFELIEAGSTVGEAAYYSVPGQSWQCILVEEPLYRPFRKGFDAQWRDREDLGEDAQYLVLRKVNLLERNGKLTEAGSMLNTAVKKYPNGLALAYRCAVLARGDSMGRSDGTP